MTRIPLLSVVAVVALGTVLSGCSITRHPDVAGETDPPEATQMAITATCDDLVPSAAERGFVSVTVDPDLEDDSDLAGIEQSGGLVCFFTDGAGTVSHVGAQLLQTGEAVRRERRWDRDGLQLVDGVGDAAAFTAVTNDVNGDTASELRVVSGGFYIQVGSAPASDAAALTPLATDAIAALSVG